ncbi:MAG: M60 family metallopeptidase [Rhodospirillales bacterium]|nr:M60 family metallopeptidase [Rhodospirillales bacterium]
MAQTVALAAVACACLPAFAETETRRVAVYVEPLKSVETTFTDKFKERLSRDFRESSIDTSVPRSHSTGLYAPRGELITLKAPPETARAAESILDRPPVASALSDSGGPTALIPDTMQIGDTVVAAVGALFSDPDGDALSYSAESSATGTVRVALTGHDTLTLVAVRRGLATITVRGSDPGGQSASVSFRVRVIGQVTGFTEGLPRRPFADAAVGDRTVGTLSLGLNRDVFPVIIMESEHWADVLVAGSWLGDGRVVAFSGQDFLSSGDRATLLGHASANRLLANAVRWARSDSAGPSRILVDNQRIADALNAQGLEGVEVVGRGPGWWEGDWSAAALRNTDVAVVQVNEWGTPRLIGSSVAALRAFVERGGGLIVAGSALHWSWWIEPNHGPFTANLLLRGTGISWNEDSIAEIGTASTDIDLRVLAPAAIWSAWLGGEQFDATQTAFLPDLFGSAAELGRFEDLDEALVRLVRETPHLPTSSAAPQARLAAAAGETLGPYEWPEAHPWAAVFPGLPAEDALRVDGTVTVDATWGEFPADASRRERHIPLGFYAPPGTLVTVEVPASHATGELAVSVGELYDNLGEGYAAQFLWRRAPWLRREFPVMDRNTAVTNAYGGSIALIVPADYSGTIPVTVRGSIPMAVYTAGESSRDEWFADLGAGAPQAIIQNVGGIRLVISAERARGITDPGEVSAFWGGFQQSHAELAGEPAPRAFESIWIFDPQVGWGYANANRQRINYPLHGEHWALVPGTAEGRAWLATLPDVGPRKHTFPPPRSYFPAADGVDWWLFGHELGHQWQTEDWGSGETYPEIGEVAVNLFTMYTLNKYLFGGGDRDIIASQEEGRGNSVDHAALHHLRWSTGPDVVGNRLQMYRQLIFEFGWEPMKAVFQSYYDPAYPRSTYGGALDGFAIRFSAIVERDLVGFFRRWEYPLSDTAEETIRSFGLEAWLPPGW